MRDDEFDALTNMVLSDMQTEVPQSFRDAVKDAPPLHDAMWRQVKAAGEPCTTCKDQAPDICSDGVHWLRAIQCGRLKCAHRTPGGRHCNTIAVAGREGRAYCAKHF